MACRRARVGLSVLMGVVMAMAGALAAGPGAARPGGLPAAAGRRAGGDGVGSPTTRACSPSADGAILFRDDMVERFRSASLSPRRRRGTKRGRVREGPSIILSRAASR
jgi:hypothetical protein